MVYDVAHTVKIPVIGMGGIATAEDAIEFMMAGATAISVGTMNFVDPETTSKIADGIEQFMKDKGIEDINDIIGCVE
jgi:dihydroorotate dehydrogenase (NAD+) catalytic subunit